MEVDQVELGGGQVRCGNSVADRCDCVDDVLSRGEVAIERPQRDSRRGCHFGHREVTRSAGADKIDDGVKDSDASPFSVLGADAARRQRRCKLRRSGSHGVSLLDIVMPSWHSRAMLEVHVDVTIRRPLEEVLAQFGDVGDHERNGHHRGVSFHVLSETSQSCSYSQVSRVGPVRLRQHFELDKSVPAHQVNALISGPFSPGSIKFDIVADGDNGANVTATLCSTRPGLTQLAAPLLRRSLARALTRSLEEDRDDLESGRYASRLGAT